MNDTEGLIVKATGGFYYVDAAGVLYECRARGVFRKQGVSLRLLGQFRQFP